MDLSLGNTPTTTSRHEAHRINLFKLPLRHIHMSTGAPGLTHLVCVIDLIMRCGEGEMREMIDDMKEIPRGNTHTHEVNLIDMLEARDGETIQKHPRKESGFRGEGLHFFLTSKREVFRTSQKSH